MSVHVTLGLGPGGPVAIKTATGRESVDRLQGEVQRLRRAGHPGVVAVVSSGPAGDGYELRTRYAGDALARWTGSLAHSAGLCAAVAATLADLHEIGLVHGRVDATHVLVGADGRPRLCSLSHPGEADPADDVHALGLLVEQLLARVGADRRGGLSWPRAAGPAGPRRALFQTAARALDPVAARRPSARALARSILAAVPGAELPPPPALPSVSGGAGGLGAWLARATAWPPAAGARPSPARETPAGGRLAIASGTAGPRPSGTVPVRGPRDVGAEIAPVGVDNGVDADGAAPVRTDAGPPDAATKPTPTPAERDAASPAEPPDGDATQAGARPDDGRRATAAPHEPGATVAGHEPDPATPAGRHERDAAAPAEPAEGDVSASPGDGDEPSVAAADVGDATPTGGRRHESNRTAGVGGVGATSPTPAPPTWPPLDRLDGVAWLDDGGGDEPPVTAPVRPVTGRSPLPRLGETRFRAPEPDEARRRRPPRGRPDPGGHRRADRRGTALRVGSACVVGLTLVAGGTMVTRSDPSDDTSSPAPAAAGATRPSGCARPATPPPAADVDGDGCREPVRVDGRIVEAGGLRWSLGEPGDVAAVGDWDCDGSASPALLRPRTGDVFVFPRWASAHEPVTVDALDSVGGGTGIRARPGSDGCDVLVVERPAGDVPLEVDR